MVRKGCILFAFIGLLSGGLFSQQVADTGFNPVIVRPEYAMGKGPVVLIDEGHNNFHTADGRYLPFARLLRVTFTGQAFKKPADAITILRFDERYLLLETDTAWVFNSKTKSIPIKDWAQGAYLKYGKGRLVLFGEAAMFTAQLAGPSQARVGMNSDYAEDNYKLLLNIIHWLDHKLA
jgi:hypothetical protein